MDALSGGALTFADANDAKDGALRLESPSLWNDFAGLSGGCDG